MKLIMENRQDRRQLKEILGYEEDKWERIANGEEPLEVSKYFEEKIKKALYKIKQEIQETTAVGQLLLQVLRGSALSKEETKFVKDQLLDVLGSVALASIFMMPGGSVAVVPLLALAKKYDIPLIPSAFRENLKQSGMKLIMENWREYLGEGEEISYKMSDTGITIIKIDEVVGEMLIMKLDLENPYLRPELALMTNKKYIYIVTDVWLSETLQGKGIGKEMYKRASTRWDPLVSQSAVGDEVSEQAERVWRSLDAKSSEPFLNKEGDITQIWMLADEETK